uniref:Uncharacterized protein n=1 Tax=Rhizophora mucronata TaxID=61149 RepID=A0A2P2NA28_RHIMU
MTENIPLTTMQCNWKKAKYCHQNALEKNDLGDAMIKNISSYYEQSSRNKQ